MREAASLYIVSGFGNKGISELEKDLNERFSPRSTQHIPGAPWHRALQDPNSIIARVSESVYGDEGSEKILIGHSYGALIALALACRERFREISKLFLIDGPLSPDVEVKPAKAGHNLFFRHYQRRVGLVRECLEVLREFELSDRVVCIGSTHDRIVPPDAKWLIEGFQTIELPDTQDFSILSVLDRTAGLNIKLPPTVKGHGLPKKKIEIVARIIQELTKFNPSSDILH